MTKIIAVGVEFVRSSGSIDVEKFDSKRSLDDADIILFQPSLGLEAVGKANASDRIRIDKRAGQKVLEFQEHWREELIRAAGNGKTVVIFLTTPQLAGFATGEFIQDNYGRMVEEYVDLNSYLSLPIVFHSTPLEGKEIRMAIRSDWFEPYWNEFSKHHSYECVIEGDFRSMLVTKSEDKVVGGRQSYGNGVFVLLPAVKIKIADDILGMGAHKVMEERMNWQKQFRDSIITLHTELNQFTEEAQPPDWLCGEGYKTQSELDLIGTINRIETEISTLCAEKSTILKSIEELSVFKHLLYENGNQLEVSVREALNLIGFDVSHFQDGTYEFDVIFSSVEGRALGECEGKDNKAINLVKIRQLHDNIERDYDLQGEEAVYAKPVLFGNAFRLHPVSDRPDFFTRHCLNKATKERAALVRTPDMYSAMSYLLDNPDDEEYKLNCRLAILETSGEIVRFPVK